MSLRGKLEKEILTSMTMEGARIAATVAGTTGDIKVQLYNGDRDIMIATGTDVPVDTSSGYAKGCLFIDTNVATGTSGLNENTGTNTSCVFNVIGAITAGEITLAQGSILVGNSSGVAAALDAKTTTRVLVGNGTTITSVALSQDVTMTNAGAVTIANNAITAVKITDGVITRAKMTVAAAKKHIHSTGDTIPTTGTLVVAFIAPEAGSLESIEINPLVALTANDTNYITWTLVNLGQAGVGTTAMLAVSDANTTKATGGVGLGINTKRALTVHGTGANLVVAQGDKLALTATMSGTLANTVTVPVYMLRFSGTT